MASITASDISYVRTATVTVVNPSGDISNGINFEISNLVSSLTIQKFGSGSGSVSAAGIVCGSDCTEIYSHGAVVVLTAAASTGSTFSGWTGCDSVNRTSCSVTMTNDKSVTASFTLNQHVLTIKKSGNGDGHSYRNWD